jgi:hypothetical protein
MMRATLATAVVLLSAACEGVVTQGGVQTEPASSERPSPDSVGPTPAPPSGRPEVELPVERLQLLPFEVRMKRLAAAVELPVNDGVFSALRARATDLGAHDFANSVAPDLAWTAARIATWVEGLLPVCADARVRSRYANWSTSLSGFALRAWGRAATSEDRAEVVAAQGLSDAEAWRVTCVSLLSSAELLTP